MQNKPLPALLFLLAPWLLPYSAQAEPAVLAEPCAAFCLTVTPSVCVTTTANQRCQQPIRIEWYGLPSINSPCAYIDSELLYCWDEADISYSAALQRAYGAWEGMVTWPEEGTVSLTDESGAIVAEVPLSTQSLKPRRAGQRWSGSK